MSIELRDTVLPNCLFKLPRPLPRPRDFCDVVELSDMVLPNLDNPPRLLCCEPIEFRDTVLPNLDKFPRRPRPRPLDCVGDTCKYYIDFPLMRIIFLRAALRVVQISKSIAQYESTVSFFFT